MKKYKMICLDIDGTLINSENKLTARTKQVIQIVSKEMKIPVILVSARIPRGILFITKQLNINNPIICYSGALIMDDKNKILSNVTIPNSEAIQVYELAKNMGIHVSLYKDDEWYAEKSDKWAEQEGVITNMSTNIVNFTDLFDLWKKEKSGPNKIMCMAEPSEIEALNAEVKDYGFNHLNAYQSKPTYLEVMSKIVSKTSAIEVLCKTYNIQSSEVIAIGDNYNDVDMIEFAGMGIAMGNAPEAVKKHADDVTLSNDEDGVAAAIEKYIL
jgi:Cof subfamily protein (haloacid dehalogenase superfamily)